MVGGVLVPPRPEEPDNCCMSGCVNCVWDQYRDDMEEWAAANAEAEQRLQEQQSPPDTVLASTSAADGTAGVDGTGASRPSYKEAVSMDDDGGGSSAHHQPVLSKDMWDDDLYKDIPVGIREFMKTEKKLKNRHQEEGSVGG